MPDKKRIEELEQEVETRNNLMKSLMKDNGIQETFLSAWREKCNDLIHQNSLVQSQEFRDAIIGECEWQYNYEFEMFNTGCVKGHPLTSEDDDLLGSELIYCPYCGKKIKEVK